MKFKRYLDQQTSISHMLKEHVTNNINKFLSQWPAQNTSYKFWYIQNRKSKGVINTQPPGANLSVCSNKFFYVLPTLSQPRIFLILLGTVFLSCTLKNNITFYLELSIYLAFILFIACVGKSTTQHVDMAACPLRTSI